MSTPGIGSGMDPLLAFAVGIVLGLIIFRPWRR
jgi:hypothetical protein